MNNKRKHLSNRIGNLVMLLLCLFLIGSLCACSAAPGAQDGETASGIERETYWFHNVKLQIPNGLSVRFVSDDRVVIASLSPTTLPDTVTMEHTSAENAAVDGLNEASVIELYEQQLDGFEGLELYRDETVDGVRRVRYELSYQSDEDGAVHLINCLFVMGDEVVTIVFTTYSEATLAEATYCADALLVRSLQ